MDRRETSSRRNSADRSRSPWRSERNYEKTLVEEREYYRNKEKKGKERIQKDKKIIDQLKKETENC